MENDDQTTMVSDVQTKNKQHLEHHLEVPDEVRIDPTLNLLISANLAKEQISLDLV